MPKENTLSERSVDFQGSRKTNEESPVFLMLNRLDMQPELAGIPGKAPEARPYVDPWNTVRLCFIPKLYVWIFPFNGNHNHVHIRIGLAADTELAEVPALAIRQSSA